MILEMSEMQKVTSYEEFRELVRKKIKEASRGPSYQAGGGWTVWDEVNKLLTEKDAEIAALKRKIGSMGGQA